MRRLLAELVVLVAVLGGCDCGRQNVTMTEASLLVPVTTLDFGVVPEGTAKGSKFRVDNNGRAPLSLSVVLTTGTSTDFALGNLPQTVEASGFVEVPITFTPTGAGEDLGSAEVNIVGSGDAPLRVALRGGPSSPALAFDPDPVDFTPAMTALERKTVQLKSVGTSALTIRAVGVSASGNPDFSVVAPVLPTRLLPGESVGVRVEYARSARSAEGLLEVLSDAADAGLATLRLLPDPPAACANLLDDDQDGLVDFPDDPGCQDAQDTDEYNPAQCVSGAMQPCGGDAGVCAGSRACVNGAWGTCTGAGAPMTETCNDVDDDCDGTVDDGVTRGCYSGSTVTRGVGNCRDGQETCTRGAWVGNCAGEVLPSVEVCGNAVDEDCSGQLDNGCGPDAGVVDAGACDPNGTFTLDAGVISYGCCDFGLGPTVNLDISSFLIQSGATVLRPSPTQPGNTLTTTAGPTCPGGAFTFSRVISGSCTETYSLTGNFVGPNTFVGTYAVSFSGAQCTTSLCAGDPCTNHSWNISAGR